MGKVRMVDCPMVRLKNISGLLADESCVTYEGCTAALNEGNEELEVGFQMVW